MINKLVIFLTCLCLALAIALGVEHNKLLEAQEENAQMRAEIRGIRVQVEQIWAEYTAQIRRLQANGGIVDGGDRR